jgi:pimeloyl-ACP methyl ester carboxylesterase
MRFPLCDLCVLLWQFIFDSRFAALRCNPAGWRNSWRIFPDRNRSPVAAATKDGSAGKVRSRPLHTSLLRAGTSRGPFWLRLRRAGAFATFALFRGSPFVFPVQECQVRFLLPLLLFAALALGGTGCGTFVAHRMVQAPNTYPTWFAPKARLALGFSPKFLTNFPAHFVEVGPPTARLRYRVVPPADYQLRVSSTNWVEHGKTQFDFTFNATVPAATNQWTAAPRGTVILLHGYGISQFAMAPWALRLGEEGWRCVLVDLRGHGKSTGKKIFFGIQETQDLSQLLDALGRDGEINGPVSAVGESYGASLALRWKTIDSRVTKVVALTPYAELSNAVVNICHDYAGWVPESFVKAGLKKLPVVLNVPPGELDTTTVLARSPVAALFVAGALDKVTPAADVERLYKLAAPGSKLIVVPDATHEATPYFFELLGPALANWLSGESGRY